MKYRVTGIEKPQHSRVGLLIPGAIVELNGADEIAKASQIRYLEPMMNEDKENIICQKNEKQSQPTRKASYGGRKQLSTKPKENF